MAFGALSLQHECVFAAIHFKPFSLRSLVCMLGMLFALDGPHGNVHVSSARWLAEWPAEGLAEWPEAGDVESLAWRRRKSAGLRRRCETVMLTEVRAGHLRSVPLNFKAINICRKTMNFRGF